MSEEKERRREELSCSPEVHRILYIQTVGAHMYYVISFGIPSWAVCCLTTTLAVLVRAYRKRLDSGRPPCIGSLGFVVVVFESRWPSMGGRWSAGRVSLFGPKGVVTERGLDKSLPSVLDFVMWWAE